MANQLMMKKPYKILSIIAFTSALALSLPACTITSTTVDVAGKSGYQPDYLTRPIQDDVFYFVLPDRFNNGDTSNDLGSTTDVLSRGGLDNTDKGLYHGGDIRGLEQKLDYIQDMGVTAIWLTPILRNQAVQGDVSGYHGYWVLDFTEIDPHLGSNADLKSLIDKAHSKGLKVFFDIITNHTADVIKYTECHGQDGAGWSTEQNPCLYKSLAQMAAGDKYTTVVPEGSQNVKSPAWLNDPKYYHNQGDTTFEGENSVYGDFFGLDDVNTDDPEVVKGMTNIFNNLVTEFKPDGFRVDTVKHVNMAFWQQFSPAVVAHAKAQGIPNFFMFGEVYDGNADVLSSFTTTGKLQSVLDFGFQGAIYQTLVAKEGTKQLKALFDRDSKYNDEDSNANELLNFVGNHDMGRFGFHLSKKHPQMSNIEKTQRSKLAHALMFFARGIPVIYYGDEQGFVGDGGNHDSRQDMMPSKVASFNDDDLLGTRKTTADDNFDKSHPLYQAFKQYAAIYRDHHGLRYGEHQTLYAGEQAGIYAFTRTDANSGEKYVIVFNTADNNQSVSLPSKTGRYQQIFSEGKAILDDKQQKLTLPGLSFAIYQ
jgi:glycosidase